MTRLALGFLVGGTVVGFSCVLARLAPGLPVSTATSTVEPRSTPVPAVCPSVPAQWIMVMDETFMANNNGWPTGPESDEYLTSNMEIGDGALMYSVEAKQNVYSYRHPHVQGLADFYLEADVRQVNGPADSFYGLVFRVSGWRHYFFAMSDNGDLAVRKREAQGGWSSALQLPPMTQVNPGERNTMTILAQGPHFVLCMNHRVVAELEDAEFREGEVGIGLSLSGVGDRATLEYTSFKVFQPLQSMPVHRQTSMMQLR